MSKLKKVQFVVGIVLQLVGLLPILAAVIVTIPLWFPGVIIALIGTDVELKAKG